MLKININLMEELKKYVYSIIKEYSNSQNREDLFQAGMLGVCEASKNYDINSGVKFTTYAYKYILGEVLKYLREDRNIHLSKDIIKDYKRINYINEYIYKSEGRPATIDEISKLLKIDKKRINEVLLLNIKEYSLSNCIDSKNDNLLLEDIICDKRCNNNYIDLKNAINELNNNEKELIYERYFENKTQTEIANKKNISQVKVYRYEKDILKKLKDKMS